MTFKVGGIRPPNAGRKRGTPNKWTADVRAVIQLAVLEVGGWRRLAAWIRESPENERAFWTMYVRSLPRIEPGSREIELNALNAKITPEEMARGLMERGLPLSVLDGLDLPELTQETR